MKKEITPAIQAEFTNRILGQFARGLDQVLKGRLRKISGRVPSSTISLIRFNIMEANAGNISADYRLYFQDSGRHSEMKNLKGGKQLPVDEIIAWIKKGRAGIIKTIPGYKSRGANIPREKQIERVAYAIAKYRGKKGQRRRGRKLKERQWINKNFYGWYNRLIEDFIVEQSTLLQDLVKQEFKALEDFRV